VPCRAGDDIKAVETAADFVKRAYPSLHARLPTL
jgi:hypothetical protein